MYAPVSLVFNGVFLPTVAVVAVGLRFHVRLSSQQKRLSLDDWVIVPALVLVCAMGCLAVAGAILGEWGRDGEVMVPTRARLTEKLVYVLVIIEKPAYGLIKLSFLFLYRRIFTFPLFRRLNEALIIFIGVWTLTFLITEIFICGSHPQYPWSDEPALVKGKCGSQEKVLLAFAITDVISDILILSMPYPCIEKLYISTRKKLELVAVFLLGTLAVVAGIVRLGFVSKAYARGSVAYNAAGNAINVLWTLVEVSVAIIAACLPVLAPLFRQLPSLSQGVSYLRRSNHPKSGRKDAKGGARKDSQGAEGSPSGSINGLVDAHTRWVPVVEPQGLKHWNSKMREALEMV